MPLLPPLVLEVGSDPQIPTFRISTYLDPQVGLTKNLGARQKGKSHYYKSWFFLLEFLTKKYPYQTLVQKNHLNHFGQVVFDMTNLIGGLFD